ncbi:uncharacterized protein LOC117651134 isoform X2 [Thrips palmi]|uniref:Uncharacterized protein LOC117651134 isoform X2 n=1 Tax=Thrips palmi TaxID=161013 RepID=A0A6P9A108_THRPL|nr:uncharacterized protein LOC117651134 isoform X2 [Thrips palmi]
MSLEPQRNSLLPAAEKVTQWLYQGTTPPPRPRQCASPTRAPSGWSLSLSVSRAKRALEEEGRSQAAKAAKTDAAQDPKVKSEPEKAVEVPQPHADATAPPAQHAATQTSTIVLKKETEDRLTRMEQQIASLRKANVQLLKRLAEQEETHSKFKADICVEPASFTPARGVQFPVSGFNKEAEVYRLRTIALEQQITSLRKANVQLLTRLKDCDAVQEKVEENKKLKESNYALSQQLGALQTEIASLRKANEQFRMRLEDCDAAPGRVEDKLKESNVVLSQQSEKSKTEVDELDRLKESNFTLAQQLEKSKSDLEEINKLKQWNLCLSQEVEKSRTEIASLKYANMQLHTRLKDQDGLQGKLEDNKRLKELNFVLSQQLEKSRTETELAVQQWCDEASKLKAKVDNQRKNLQGLEAKLLKANLQPDPAAPAPKGKECSSSECRNKELEALVVRQRTRLRNQSAHLSQLAAALARQKQKSPHPGQFIKQEFIKQEPGCDANTQTPSDCIKTEPESTVVLQPQPAADLGPPACTPMNWGGDAHLQEVSKPDPRDMSILQLVTKAFPMGNCIIGNFKELGLRLPSLWPPVQAAIAAMPPATRTWLLGRVHALGLQLPTGTQFSPVTNNNSYAVVSHSSAQVRPIPCSSQESVVAAHHQSNGAVPETPVASLVDAGTQTNVDASLVDAGSQTNVDISETSIDAGTQTNVHAFSVHAVSQTDVHAFSVDAGSQTNVDASLVHAGTQANVDALSVHAGTQTNVDASSVDAVTQTNVDISWVDAGSQTNVGASSVDAGSQTNVGASSVDAGSQTNVGASSVDAGSQTNVGAFSVDAGTQANVDAPSVDAGTQTNVDVTETSVASSPGTAAADRECSLKLTPLVTEPSQDDGSPDCQDLDDVRGQLPISSPIKTESPFSTPMKKMKCLFATSVEQGSPVSTPAMLHFPLAVPLKQPVALPTTPKTQLPLPTKTETITGETPWDVSDAIEEGTVYGPSLPPSFLKPLRPEESPKREEPSVVQFKTPLATPLKIPPKTPTKTITDKEFIGVSDVTTKCTDEAVPQPRVYGPHLPPSHRVPPQPEESAPCRERVVFHAKHPVSTKTPSSNVHGGAAGSTDPVMWRGPAVYGPKLPPPASALPPPPFAFPIHLPLPPPAVELAVGRTAQLPVQVSTERQTSTAAATSVVSGGTARKSTDALSATAGLKLAVGMPTAVSLSLSPAGRPQAGTASSTAAASSLSFAAARAVPAVPAAVGYPRYLYEGLRFDQRRAPSQSAATAAGVGVEAGSQFGPKLPPPASALPAPPFAFPLHLPPPPAAVPIDASCRFNPRKRPAQEDDGAPKGKQAPSSKRNPRISSDIEVLKKRIVQHLKLDGKR